jgi:hypothetical protein
MDELERGALGIQAPRPDTFIPVDETGVPLSGGDTAVEIDEHGNPMPGQSRQPQKQDLDSTLQTPRQDAADEKWRQQTLRDYQRRLSDMQRQSDLLRTQQEQASQILQTAQLVAQQRQQSQQESTTLLDDFPPAVRAGMTPEAQQILEALDAGVDAKLERRLEQAKTQLASDPQTRALQEKVAGLERQLMADSLVRQAQAVELKYGRDTIEPYQQDIIQAMQRYPGMSVENALTMVAPDVYADWKQRNQNKSHPNPRQGELSGTRPSPNASPKGGYRPGESIQETVARLTGGTL